jgi:adenylate cyclase
MRLNPHYPPVYLSNLGTSYCGIGRYTEAVSVHQRALARNPNLLLSRICLAACYSMAGREEARAQVTEIRRLSPQLTLEAALGAVPFKDPTANKPIFEALCKAGLE